jgi:hypothetical protein
MKAPICMTEEFWANSQLSVARYTGGIEAFGHEYVIVNKEGIDIFALSRMAEKAGRAKAIESGEPADLVRKDFQVLYHKLGRDAFIQVLRDNPNSDDKDIKRKMQALIDDKKSERRKKKDNQLTLF